MVTRYRQWRLRRRIRARARELADNWTAGVVMGNRENLERLIYETLCKDHDVKP